MILTYMAIYKVNEAGTLSIVDTGIPFMSSYTSNLSNSSPLLTRFSVTSPGPIHISAVCYHWKLIPFGKIHSPRYEIQVTSNEDNWKIKKTYSEFSSLDTLLRTKYKKEIKQKLFKMPNFPNKTKNENWSDVREMEQLRDQLNDYLAELTMDLLQIKKELLEFLQFSKSVVDEIESRKHEINLDEVSDRRHYSILNLQGDTHTVLSIRELMQQIYCTDYYFRVHIQEKFSSIVDDVYYIIRITCPLRQFQFEKSLNDINALHHKLKNFLKFVPVPELPLGPSSMGSGLLDRLGISQVENYLNTILNDPEYYCVDVFDFFEKCTSMIVYYIYIYIYIDVWANTLADAHSLERKLFYQLGGGSWNSMQGQYSRIQHTN